VGVHFPKSRPGEDFPYEFYDRLLIDHAGLGARGGRRAQPAEYATAQVLPKEIPAQGALECPVHLIPDHREPIPGLKLLGQTPLSTARAPGLERGEEDLASTPLGQLTEAGAIPPDPTE